MGKHDEPPRVLEAEPLGDGFFPDAFELEDGGGGHGSGHGPGHGHVTAKQAKDFFHEQIGDAPEKPRPGDLAAAGEPEPPERERPDVHAEGGGEAVDGVVPGGGVATTDAGEVTDAGGFVEPQPEPNAGAPLPLEQPKDEPPRTLSE
jgi:hypothetical protein